MGTRDELERLAQFCAVWGIRPVIDSTHPPRDARAGFEAIDVGDDFAKIVCTV